MPSLDDLSSTSQGIFSKKSTEQSALKTDNIRIPPALWDRDEMDLMLLKWSGESPDGVEGSTLLAKVALSYGALSTRMLKLNELGLLQRSRRNVGRPGPAPYVYSLNGVTLETVEAVIHERGIDVQQFEQEQIEKRFGSKPIDATVNHITVEEDEVYQECGQKDDDTDVLEDVWNNNGDSHFTPEIKNDTYAEDVNYCATSNNTPEVDTTDTLIHIAPNELSRTVTVGEILEMVDEATDTLIKTVTESFAELLNEKVTKLNARIAELEQQLSKSQGYQSCQEPTEELLRRSRFLVRQKLRAKSASTQNGNGTRI